MTVKTECSFYLLRTNIFISKKEYDVQQKELCITIKIALILYLLCTW